MVPVCLASSCAGDMEEGSRELEGEGEYKVRRNLRESSLAEVGGRNERERKVTAELLVTSGAAGGCCYIRLTSKRYDEVPSLDLVTCLKLDRCSGKEDRGGGVPRSI